MAKRFTTSKIQSVSLPKRSYASYSYVDPSGFVTKNEAMAGTYQTSDWGRSWHRKLEVDTYIDGLSIDDAIEELRKRAEGVENAYVDVTRDEDDYPRVNITGTRPATEEEAAEVLRYLELDKARREANDNAQRERLIAQAKALGIKPEDLS